METCLFTQRLALFYFGATSASQSQVATIGSLFFVWPNEYLSNYD